MPKRNSNCQKLQPSLFPYKIKLLRQKRTYKNDDGYLKFKLQCGWFVDENFNSNLNAPFFYYIFI